MSELIKNFSEKYKTRVKRIGIENAEYIIPGKFNDSHLYEFSKDKIGVVCLFNTPNRWNKVRKMAEEKGMMVLQNGDIEGTFIINPLDDLQCRIAIQAIRVKMRRQLSEEARVAQSERGKQVMEDYWNGRKSLIAGPDLGLESIFPDMDESEEGLEEIEPENDPVLNDDLADSDIFDPGDERQHQGFHKEYAL